jgi:hypothetical protein
LRRRHIATVMAAARRERQGQAGGVSQTFA